MDPIVPFDMIHRVWRLAMTRKKRSNTTDLMLREVISEIVNRPGSSCKSVNKQTTRFPENVLKRLRLICLKWIDLIHSGDSDFPPSYAIPILLPGRLIIINPTICSYKKKTETNPAFLIKLNRSSVSALRFWTGEFNEMIPFLQAIFTRSSQS